MTRDKLIDKAAQALVIRVSVPRSRPRWAIRYTLRRGWQFADCRCRECIAGWWD